MKRQTLIRLLSAVMQAVLCFLVSCPALDPKEINLKQGNKNIPSGGSHNFGITIADGDDAIATGWIVFTIESSGTADITINDIYISGGNSDDFDLDTSTLTYTIAPQKNTTFSIRFDPIEVGSKTALVTIENNDADEGSYTFTITGTAIEFAPEINVKQGATIIPDGTGSYDFGIIYADGAGGVTSGAVIFTIQNIGNEDLTITDVSITAGDTGHFLLNNTASSPVAGGGSTTFTITFDPLSSGSKSATVAIGNNDPDEGNHTFTVIGTGQRPPFSGNTLSEYLQYLFGTSAEGFGPYTTTGAGGNPVFNDSDDTITITSTGDLWFEIIFTTDGTSGGNTSSTDYSQATSLTLTYSTTKQATLYFEDSSTEVFSNNGIYDELLAGSNRQFTANLSNFTDLNWVVPASTQMFNKQVFKIMIGSYAGSGATTFIIHNFTLQ